MFLPARWALRTGIIAVSASEWNFVTHFLALLFYPLYPLFLGVPVRGRRVASNLACAGTREVGFEAQYCSVRLIFSISDGQGCLSGRLLHNVGLACGVLVLNGGRASIFALGSGHSSRELRWPRCRAWIWRPHVFMGFRGSMLEIGTRKGTDRTPSSRELRRP